MDSPYLSRLTESENAFAQAAEARARDDFENSPDGARKAFTRRWFRIAGGVAGGAAILLLILGPFAFQWPGRITGSVAASLLLLAIILTATGHYVYESAASAYRPRARAEALQDLQAKKEKALADASLPALLLFNREDMRQYHDIATTVARRASRLSAVAMTVGFVVLIAGAVSAVRVEDETSKVIVGSLTALGGIFSGYITKTFFTAEDKAVNQLYKYWQQPREASYLLAAERVARDLKDPAQEKELGKVIAKALSIVLLKEQLRDAADGNGNGSGPPRTGRPPRSSSRRGPTTARTTRAAKEQAKIL